MDNLHKSSLISEEIDVVMSTLLFGADSGVDSMAFVVRRQRV
jgi:hypothetical protein